LALTPLGLDEGMVRFTFSGVERSPQSTSMKGRAMGALLNGSSSRRPTTDSSTSHERTGGVMSLSGTLSSSSAGMS